MNRRLVSTSSDKRAYLEDIDHYQQALYNSDYKEKLLYEGDNKRGPTRFPKRRSDKGNRQRKIIWFLPPGSCYVEGDI